MGFHRVVVRQQGHEPAVGDPAQQPLIPPIQCGARRVQNSWIGLLVHLQHGLSEAGAQADEIAFLDRHPVALQHLHQIVVADDLARPSEMRLQIDHHAAALNATLRHVLHAQVPRTRRVIDRAGISRPIVAHRATISSPARNPL